MLRPNAKLFLKNLIYPVLKLKPDFLIIGTAKGGTTSLFKYLCTHPQLACPHRKKEIHYFNNDDNYKKGLGWYLTAFPFRFDLGHFKTFEATPHYLHYPKAAQRIRRDLGKIKLLVSLREPASRAYSAWKMFHSFSNNHQKHLRRLYDVRTFSNAISDELNDRSSIGLKDYKYIEYGLYATQLQRYFELFGRKNIMVFDFKDLCDPNVLMNDICHFLGLDHLSDERLSDMLSQKFNQGPEIDMTIEDRTTFNELYQFFKPHNAKLFKALGKSFDW